MSAVPAWKRAGLKQTKQAAKKDTASYDPLKEGLKRAHESGEAKTPKPAKKPKLPKAERPAKTHELDQLFYLRQYSEDRDNWKFSKQKQNWILKHMFTDIDDDKYNEPLINYVNGLQGSSRNWVVEDAKDVVKRWNDFMKASEEDKEKDAEKEDENVEDQQKKKNKKIDDDDDEIVKGDDEKNEDGKKASTKRASKGTKQESKPDPRTSVPTEKMARRAQSVIKSLAGEHIALELLDEQ